MPFRLNGWRRIGVVLSALWAVVVCSVAFISYTEATPYSQNRFVVWRNVKDGKELKAKSHDANWAELLQEAQKRGLVEPTKSLNVNLFFMTLFVPVLIGWLASYLSVWTVRWIVWGFYPPSKPPT